MNGIFDFLDEPLSIGGILKFLTLPIWLPLFILMKSIEMAFSVIIFLIKVLVIKPLKERKVDKEK